ncbi:MAG TPA: lycopene beta-cyclase CrtY [Noviherbaspirillum sp.]|jgi:lycopene beta-cyclase|uniref:lycopene beta-cyclase CrtY n=1 Tax=Noviherbaspirillum sp. TaxID=1926288 RepID=UPI002F9421D9
MHDLILVGGGLANGLIAWRLKILRPDLRVLLVEQAPRLGGNHTWSFYQKDLSAAQHAWLRPAVVHSWPGYEVRFPGHWRRLDTACHSITSSRFHAVLSQLLGEAAICGAAVTEVQADSVRIDGRRFAAGAVVDGRGHLASPHMRYAYQKFLGQELELEAPHEQALPVIMDATVPQDGGYRFVYTLPFAPKRILVEDTCYSNAPELDQAQARARIAGYVAARGWKVAALAREETGILPIALSGDIDAFWGEACRRHPCSGLRAGLFHATTGYSLPVAVNLADRIAGLPLLDANAVYQAIRDYSVAQWHSQGFMRLLNRMLFFAGPASLRYRVLQRFYTLPQALIERFYAGQLNRFDELRILSGKPPVPVLPALRAAFRTGERT